VWKDDLLQAPITSGQPDWHPIPLPMDGGLVERSRGARVSDDQWLIVRAAGGTATPLARSVADAPAGGKISQ